MASDSDDAPLARRNNGHVSQSRISKSDDRAMDNDMNKAIRKNGLAPPGITLHNGLGAKDSMDLDQPAINGASKRKARNSMGKVSYAETSEENDEDAPLAKRQKTTVEQKIESGSDDDIPLARSRKSHLISKVTATDAGLDMLEDDDEPLEAKMSKRKAAIEKDAAKEAKSIRALEQKSKKSASKKIVKKETSGSEQDVKPRKRKSNGPIIAKKSAAAKKEESESDIPLATKKKTSVRKANGVKAEVASPSKKSKKKGASEEPENEVYRWWDAPKKEDDSIKWETLQHNGVAFPPEYESLPKDIKLRYDGVPVTLSIEAEEIASSYGGMLSSPNCDNPTFQKNFFIDFVEEVEKTGGARGPGGNKVIIKDFSRLDFKPIFNYYEGKREAKKARSVADKKAEKAAKDEAEKPYKTCNWDGREEEVGNFRVEPPGLFRGRGEHPKTGTYKRRVVPEQITINIGKDAMVPSPPEGHKWKAVQHDQKATWLAMWQENVNGNYKYVMLAASSSIKGQSDYKKFEKARELKKYIDRIRNDYQKDMKAELMADRQRATAMYLIDKLALRAGNEKDAENEAETVGCCSLKYEHITLKPPNIVIFDFLGKDSIRFHQECTLDTQAFKNLKMFKKEPKGPGDDIFDRLTTSQLNKHLGNYMTGLTAKVFRTYNASWTMQEQMAVHAPKIQNLSLQEKYNAYEACNREVALICNHKKTVTATHQSTMAKMAENVKGLKYRKWRQKQMILDIDPKQKKKRGAEWFELDEELDAAWVLEHQAFLVAELKTKIEKKFQKENDKLANEGQKEMKAKELTERLSPVNELGHKFKKENKTKKIEAEGKSPSIEKCEAAIVKIEEQINTRLLQAENREGNKEVALGTSKINYIDPRLTVVFAKKFDVPIEKFFSKTLRDKFNWAMETINDDEEWEF